LHSDLLFDVVDSVRLEVQSVDDLLGDMTRMMVGHLKPGGSLFAQRLARAGDDAAQELDPRGVEVLGQVGRIKKRPCDVTT
jgi:hypothetical protein